LHKMSSVSFISSSICSEPILSSVMYSGLKSTGYVMENISSYFRK
jgi:hypothetical protein